MREMELVELMRKDMMETNIREREVLSHMLASDLHEDWRNTRKRADGTYEPRMKKSKDESWNRRHGTDEVDIANTQFKDLPSNWQYENLEAARTAIDLVFADVMMAEDIDEEKMERMAGEVHKAWVGRNDWVKDPQYGNPVLAGDYESLPEEEKEKDRAQLRLAIEHVRTYKKLGKRFIEEKAEEFGLSER